jgi:hypothetical protein
LDVFLKILYLGKGKAMKVKIFKCSEGENYSKYVGKVFECDDLAYHSNTLYIGLPIWNNTAGLFIKKSDIICEGDKILINWETITKEVDVFFITDFETIVLVEGNYSWPIRICDIIKKVEKDSKKPKFKVWDRVNVFHNSIIGNKGTVKDILQDYEGNYSYQLLMDNTSDILQTCEEKFLVPLHSDFSKTLSALAKEHNCEITVKFN